MNERTYFCAVCAREYPIGSKCAGDFFNIGRNHPEDSYTPMTTPSNKCCYRCYTTAVVGGCINRACQCHLLAQQVNHSPTVPQSAGKRTTTDFVEALWKNISPTVPTAESVPDKKLADLLVDSESEYREWRRKRDERIDRNNELYFGKPTPPQKESDLCVGYNPFCEACDHTRRKCCGADHCKPTPKESVETGGWKLKEVRNHPAYKAAGELYDKFIPYVVDGKLDEKVLDEIVDVHVASILSTSLLTEKRVREKIQAMKRIRKPTHGICCTCQKCGGPNDGECDCPRNEVIDEVLSSLTNNKE